MASQTTTRSQMPPRSPGKLRRRRQRRGNYSIMFGTAMIPLLGMGAFSIDLSMLALAKSECQDIADAAADAGLISLRNSDGNKGLARSVAREVVVSNRALGGVPEVVDIEVGRWQDDSFTADESDDDEGSNSVRVEVTTDVDFVLAPLINSYSSTVRAEAVAAARPVELILVMDITNSWNQRDFTEGARAAAVRAYDLLAANAGPDDLLGMAVFTGRYGVEHTPLMTFADHEVASSGGSGLPTREDWEILHTASKTTNGRPGDIDTQRCNPNGANNFGDPDDECYPNMWREWIDESGTDHSMGLQMAGEMFGGPSPNSAYRAVIILTDGNPNGTGSHTDRNADGYVETRWDFLRADVSRSTADVQVDTVTEAIDLSADFDTNIWAISFDAPAEWMVPVTQGEGYYERVDDPEDLVPLFQSIVESLPVALVK